MSSLGSWHPNSSTCVLTITYILYTHVDIDQYMYTFLLDIVNAFGNVETNFASF